MTVTTGAMLASQKDSTLRTAKAREQLQVPGVTPEYHKMLEECEFIFTDSSVQLELPG